MVNYTYNDVFKVEVIHVINGNKNDKGYSVVETLDCNRLVQDVQNLGELGAVKCIIHETWFRRSNLL